MGLFGPSKQEIWRELSERIGGRYVPRTFWNGDKVQASHREWTITLDTYTVHANKTYITYTRLRAPYVNPDGFRFTIYRRSVFSGVATWLGMQDIEIGIPPFDDDFVVKATHESRVRDLLSSERVRTLIDGQRSIRLTVKDDEGCFRSIFPDGVDELYFAVPGLIREVERLEALYELFAEVLDRLVETGSAYARDPDVSL